MYNFDGSTKVEIGDGRTSRVYLGDIDGNKVAVKQLICYFARFTPVLVGNIYKRYNIVVKNFH